MHFPKEVKMHSIEEKALMIYQKNREFLQKNHPEILTKIDAFETNITNNPDKEHYSLEYIQDYFDVKNNESHQYLYSQDSNLFSQKLTDLVNFSKKSFIFDGFAMYKDYEKNQKNFDDITKGLEGIYPIMSYYLHNIPENPQMIEIEKFIFIGVGLGMHITKTDAKIQALEYFIIEDDLELFRLSLFTTEYYTIQGQITFSINENKEEFTHNFNKFLSNSFFRNKYLKYLYFTAHSNEKIKLIKNALSSQNFSSFPYKTLLEKTTRQLEYMRLGYQFIDFSKQFIDNTLANKPLLIVAAGPSFSTNIEWLVKHQDNYIILCVSAVLNKLYEKGIQPDIVTHLDGFDPSKKHLEGFDAANFLSHTILLSGNFTPLEVLEKFKKENVFIMEELSTDYHEGFDSYSGPCVGSTAVFQALTMGFKEIYTYGIDLALDEKGHSHTNSHVLTKNKYDLEKIKKLENTISFRGDFFSVPGNFKKEVYTSPLFYSSLHYLHTSIPLLKTDSQYIYNLSNGAYIKGAIPTKLETLAHYDTLNKKELHHQLLEILKNHSMTSLSSTDIASLKERLVFAQTLHKYFSEYKKNPLPLQKEQYLHNLISLMLSVLIEPTRENRNLVTIYDYFFSYAAPIIFDFFNTQNLDNIPEHIKEFNRLFIDEMIAISSVYMKRLESFLVSIEAL